MPNLPKPPKPYYYLAGLAVFIIILSGLGLYFYKKNEKPVLISILTPTQTPQNSLTSNDTSNKPKEENLTSTTPTETQISSASFDADPNTDVIVFEECGISFKVNKINNIKAYKYTEGSIFYGIFNYENTSNDRSKYTDSEMITCGDVVNKNNTFKPVDDLPRWLNPYKNQITFNQDSPDIYFKIGNINYKLHSPTTKPIDKLIISSIKFNTTEGKKSNILPITDLSKIESNTPKPEDLEKNYKKVKDVSILGCNEIIFRISFCLLMDENSDPLIDLNKFQNKDGFDIIDGSLVELGKKSSNGRYIVSKYGDVCVMASRVFEFNFTTGKISDLTPNKPYQQSGCAGIEVGEDQVEMDCWNNSKGGVEAKKCFKKDSDYQKYLKAYNEEQAKNKAVERELAKYLE